MDKQAYAVAITSVDPARKVLAIMRVREITGIDIADAKAIVERAPSVIMDGLPLSQASELSELLQSVGMKTDITADAVHKPEPKLLLRITFGDPLEAALSATAIRTLSTMILQSDDQRLQRLITGIRQLWKEWDPAHIRDPEPDQYDAYLIPTLHLLSMKASMQQIVVYLNWVALEHMGVSKVPKTEVFAARLRKWFAGEWKAAGGGA
jgi:hypothetical protein